MNSKDVGKKLDDFLKLLSQTQVNIIYFTVERNNKLIPALKTTFKTWKLPSNKVVLISEGVTSGWCYIYDLQGVQKMVDVDSNGNTSFGGSIPAELANHTTIGVRPRYPNGVTLNSHLTIYAEDKAMVNSFFRTAITCNIYLNPNDNVVPLNAVCDSFQNITPVSSLQDIYKNVPQCIEYVQQISRILYGSYPGGAFTLYQGKQYKIHKGQRGGNYVVRKGKRVYINSKTKMLQGGSNVKYKGVGFTDPVVDFIKHYILQPVVELNADVYKVRVLYDADAALSPKSNENIIIMYDFNDQQYTHCFYIDARKTFAAFYASSLTSTPTPYEKKCFEEFQNFSTNVLPTIIVA